MDVGLEFFDYPNITFGPILPILFNNDQKKIQERSMKFVSDFLLINEFSKEAVEIYVNNLLFWANLKLNQPVIDWQILKFTLDLCCKVLESKVEWSKIESISESANVLFREYNSKNNLQADKNFKNLLYKLSSITNESDNVGIIPRIMSTFMEFSIAEKEHVGEVKLIMTHMAKYLSNDELNTLVNKALSLNVFTEISQPLLDHLMKDSIYKVEIDSKYVSKFLLHLSANFETLSVLYNSL